MFDNLFKNPINRNTAIVQAEEKERYYQPYYYFVDLEERIFREEEQEKQENCLKRAVGKLTTKQRECLVMNLVYELKQRQIAKNLGIGQRTVSQHIDFAKKNIKKYFDNNLN